MIFKYGRNSTEQKKLRKNLLTIFLLSFSLGLMYSCQKTSTTPNNLNASKPATQISSTPSVIPTTIQVDSTTTATKALKINDVPAFITANCTYCHSNTPSKDSDRTSAAAGITFDSEEEMIKSAMSIKRSTVTKKTMPIGKIKITDKDRITIGKWLDSKTIKVTPTPSPLVIQPVAETKTAQEIITQKCAYCHATTPEASSGYSKAPMSITFNSEAEMISNLSKINQSTIVDKSMPIGNITLSEAEKTSISDWIKSKSDTNPIVVKSKTPTELIIAKCTYCHSAKPDPSSGYTKPPKRLTFDTEKEMTDKHDSIHSTIQKREMPIDNITMTDQERAIVLQWAEKIETDEKNQPWLYRIFH